MSLNHSKAGPVKHSPRKTSIMAVRQNLRARPVVSRTAKKISVKPRTNKESKPKVVRDSLVVPRRSQAPRVAASPATRTRQLLNTQQRMRQNVANNKATSIRTRHSRRSIDKRVDPAEIDSIKKIGQGRILVIVGNGPSHAEAKLEKLKEVDNLDFMCINRPDDRVFPSKFWMFCDNSQLRRHKKLWNSFNTGILINSSAVRERKKNTVRIRTMHGQGFSNNMHKGMFVGRSSVYAAMQVGLWMDYDHIYVFGCDMCAVGGKLYPWGSNPDVSDNNRIKRFDTEATFYNWAANNAHEKFRKKFTFCTSYNKYKFVDIFGRLDHREAIDIIIDRHNNNDQK